MSTTRANNSAITVYITYDVWVAFELVVVYFLFIETGNKSLEETAAILDGEEVQEKFVNAAAHTLEEEGFVVEESIKRNDKV
jgi:hypothetical protein